MENLCILFTHDYPEVTVSASTINLLEKKLRQQIPQISQDSQHRRMETPDTVLNDQNYLYYSVECTESNGTLYWIGQGGYECLRGFN